MSKILALFGKATKIIDIILWIVDLIKKLFKWVEENPIPEDIKAEEDAKEGNSSGSQKKNEDLKGDPADEA